MGSAISIYPTGAAGLALLILRLSLGGQLLFLAFAGVVALPGWGQWVAGIAALGLVTGSGMRVWAVALFIGGMAGFAGLPAPLGPLVGLSGVASLALALLGPGALSVDARLFGRRVISIGDRR